MTKLTQEEAQVLISKAWKDVEKYSLGSCRFGQRVWRAIPDDVLKIALNPELVGVNFYFEPNSDIVIEKFYKYFVEQ